VKKFVLIVSVILFSLTAIPVSAQDSPIATPDPGYQPPSSDGDPLTENLAAFGAIVAAIAAVYLVIVQFFPDGIAGVPLSELQRAGELAAGYAEQMAKLGQVEKNHRLEYAIGIAITTLRQAGYNIDADSEKMASLIELAIEAAVARLG